MAGTFSKDALPKRPGAYFRFEARESEPRLENTLGVAVVPFTHSWGPEETVVECNSFAEFIATFGQGGTTPPTYTQGYRAVYDCFRGEGIPGWGGAGRVLAYRMVGSAGAAAARISTGTGAAITATARYKGTFGNKIAIGIETDAAAPTTTHNYVVFVDGFEVERWRYSKTDINDLSNQINGVTPYETAKSDWISAGTVTSGAALTPTTVSAGQTLAQAAPTMTGGVDGTTTAALDWSTLMTAVEPQRFSIFACTDLVDSMILASVKSWAQNLNAKGKRFVTVVGGALDEDYATATGTTGGSAQLNDPDFVRLGIGTYTDTKFGDVSTAMLAPRLAGIIAARGDALGLTFARFAGLSIKTGATENDIIRAIDKGVITMARDSSLVAPVRLEKAVTTFQTTNDAARPFAVYSNPKFVRTMHGLETELLEFAEENVIGKLPVNAGTRDFLRGAMAARMQARENRSVIQPGWTVTIDPTPAPTPQDDFVALLYSMTFTRGLEKILNTVIVG